MNSGAMVGGNGGNGGGGGPGMASSEYVRKELKAVVGARTIQRGLSSGPVVNLNHALGQALSSPMNHRTSPPMMVPGGKPLNQADLEALGLSYELPQGMNKNSNLNAFDLILSAKIDFFLLIILGSDVLHGRLWDSPNMGESPSQTMPSSRV